MFIALQERFPLVGEEVEFTNLDAVGKSRLIEVTNKLKYKSFIPRR